MGGLREDLKLEVIGEVLDRRFFFVLSGATPDAKLSVRSEDLTQQDKTNFVDGFRFLCSWSPQRR
jgi:hypothetical protein